MKVFTAEQMRAFDKTATEEYGIPSIVLMENAALRVVEFLEAKFSPLSEKKIVVLCGKGNNGGDGLAIARHLRASKLNVKVIFAADSKELKGDAQTNFKILSSDQAEASRVFLEVNPKDEAQMKIVCETMASSDILIDALLGTGFSGEIRDPILSVINNSFGARKRRVAVDVPSGLESDSGRSENYFAANYTVSFVAPKLGHFLREGLEASGEVWTGDIGTLPSQLFETQTGVQIIDLEEAKCLSPERSLDAHKGDAGRALICGGSFGMSGAIALASKAALKIGAGLCIAALPEKILPAFAASVLEATSHALPDDENGFLLEKSAEKLPELWKNVQVVALGPGLGRSEGAQAFARRVVKECPQPLIIDADGLFSLPEMAEEVKNRPGDTILTPHPGEMGNLMGISAREVNDDRFGVVKACAEKYGAWTVLKGARTLVSSPDGEIWVNLTGNPGMATGGSGDALTGTIAGLLAQLKNAGGATKLGVYLHGLAGDICFRSKGNGLIAGDIVEALPLALQELKTREPERINGRLRKLE